MAEEVVYKKEQIAQVIASAQNLFDVVRLVDPISLTVFAVEDGKLVSLPGGCHHVWGKEDRCDNCISAKCLLDEKRYSKFEFIDQDIFHVVAQPVDIEGERYVLEVVTASNDDVLLSAYGNNDFVERITEFNQKIYADELTGVSNRRCMNDRFAILAESSGRKGNALAVAMIDVDDFKHVNDTLGHLAGDTVLREVAQLLLQAFKPGSGDILARYGGDEFFVALKDVSREELEKRIVDMRTFLAESSLGVTLSIGAYYQQHAKPISTEKLILKADEAMYSVKAAAKNGYAIRE